MEELLSLRESAGLSLRALSEESGIPLGTLSWWSHRLRMAEEAAPGFAEVRMVDAWEGEGAASASGPEIVVRYPDGVAVEMRGPAAEQALARALSTIERWS